MRAVEFVVFRKAARGRRGWKESMRDHVGRGTAHPSSKHHDPPGDAVVTEK